MEKEPRLTLFAGPNGSGKSTLVDEQRAEWIGHYLNADDLEKALAGGGYPLADYPGEITQADPTGLRATIAPVVHEVRPE
jgi:predicted kinase